MTRLGDALVEALFRHAVTSTRRVPRLATWLADAARPPRGLRLVSEDGSTYSGLVLVEANEPVLMVALCVAASRPRAERSQSLARSVEEPYWHDLDDPSYR